MKTNYEELEGTEVDFDGGDIIIRGIVIGCDYDIGLTIVAKEDKDQYLLCLRGPSSPHWNNYEKAEKEHKALFFSTVSQIKKGLISADMQDAIAISITREPGGISPSSDSCPFNQ